METISTSGNDVSLGDKLTRYGLVSDAVVKSGEILWPSGIHQKVDDVSADQMLTIDEPDQPVPAKNLQVQVPVGK